MALIDAFLPQFEFREFHSRRVGVRARRAVTEMRRVDLADSPVIGPLFRLRSLGSRQALQAGVLGEFLERSFVLLHEEPGRGFVYGAIGAFWSAGGGVRRFAPDGFASNRDPGVVRLAWSFEFEPIEERAGWDRTDPVACLASTETRIACNDPHARRMMWLYWLAIRPASGLIRREMLRLLARRCSHRPSSS
jgi:hypothetical protein